MEASLKKSRTLLKKVYQLEGLYPSKNMVKKFENVFKALTDIMSACYSYRLAADYVTKSKKFSRACLDLTPKVHAVMDHWQELYALTGRELGPWSEQDLNKF